MGGGVLSSGFFVVVVGAFVVGFGVVVGLVVGLGVVGLQKIFKLPLKFSKVHHVSS